MYDILIYRSAEQLHIRPEICLFYQVPNPLLNANDFASNPELFMFLYVTEFLVKFTSNKSNLYNVSLNKFILYDIINISKSSVIFIDSDLEFTLDLPAY